MLELSFKSTTGSAITFNKYRFPYSYTIFIGCVNKKTPGQMHGMGVGLEKEEWYEEC